MKATTEQRYPATPAPHPDEPATPPLGPRPDRSVDYCDDQGRRHRRQQERRDARPGQDPSAGDCEKRGDGLPARIHRAGRATAQAAERHHAGESEGFGKTMRLLPTGRDHYSPQQSRDDADEERSGAERFRTRQGEQPHRLGDEHGPESRKIPVVLRRSTHTTARRVPLIITVSADTASQPARIIVPAVAPGSPGSRW